jgi:hypothetical protein
MKTRTRPPMTWVLVAALAIVATFTVVQVVRSVNSFLYWRIHADEPIERWMRIGFVAHSYHVPPHILHQALGIAIWPPDHRPLDRIAQARGMSFETARAKLLYAIVHARPPYPPPAPPPPRPTDAAR